MEVVFDVFIESLTDCLRMLPILYLSYLLMELLEHRAGKRMRSAVASVGKAGPLIGAGLGIIPQCGFSGAVAGLYAGGIASAGTLIAVLISTSDEMIPVLLSGGVGGAIIGKMLIGKFICGTLSGFIVDAFVRRGRTPEIHDLCEREHCHCENKNIFVSSAIHCAQVLAVIFAVMFVLGIAIESGGGEVISGLLPDIPVVSGLITGVIGLIPSCSVSVLLSGLYAEGVLSASALMCGLCVNGGVGLLVLFRLNRNVKDCLKIVGLLYLSGVMSGLLIGLFV